MKNAIAVTGMGMITAIGNNVAQNYHSLLQKQHGIKPLQHISGKHQHHTLVGEVSLTNEALIEKLGTEVPHYCSRTSLLAAIAAKEAMSQAGITAAADMPIVLGTSVAGMDIFEQHFPHLQQTGTLIQRRDVGDSSAILAKILGRNGYVTAISTACSSAANAIGFGARLLRSGRADRVLVGGSDALSKFTINGFDSLMLLSDQLNRPFDSNRKGLNLGEGAGFLVLESTRSLKNTKKPILGYLNAFSNANDAFHQTSTSDNGEGAYLAMQEALKMAELIPSEIDYINAHGTATENNDRTEATAIQRLFNDTIPPFSSTKSYTGHTLGASAGIEAIYALLAIQHQLAFANLRFENIMEQPALPPLAEHQRMYIRHVLSNSFGFGGNCSSLIFSHA
ncbi:beta-ketoacyl-[acyl-carrier-protein] synthase family protein [Sphingobacterium sp. BIGb0116]|uniref:beta-ketoacyl-[acyl-carrier-protein] synthase family protein n=1 Tax=Sphingobacterium sp. BIGb0116 TaxID=2940619 RepID=UPI002169A46D|nr:beta-ketoacyl-[acyl-carrier-protein] synthase family protein [Sphingobacterium sp. BIGb0116]MCS4165722.1 3-oxoacyl-[acyl-carrier-protein] synthase-1 [Sphingobacterium sp. BIGb0116]